MHSPREFSSSIGQPPQALFHQPQTRLVNLWFFHRECAEYQKRLLKLLVRLVVAVLGAAENAQVVERVGDTRQVGAGVVRSQRAADGQRFLVLLARLVVAVLGTAECAQVAERVGDTW